MIKNSDSLKSKISFLSKESKIPNKYILQNYMFESLLKRISISQYKENFIIKGGLLLSSIFGVDLRSTMDLDTTLKGIPLNIDEIHKIIEEIINIEINDNIIFNLENIKEIRLENKYKGFNINLSAKFDKIKTNLMMDITTGDVITFKEIHYKYKTLFDEEFVDILAYNYETIIAEKYETIISRNVENTRMKDFYDLYMFYNTKWNNINFETLNKAIINTFKNRNSDKYLNNIDEIIKFISNDRTLKEFWIKYTRDYDYAKNIKYEEIIKVINIINNNIKGAK